MFHAIYQTQKAVFDHIYKHQEESELLSFRGWVSVLIFLHRLKKAVELINSLDTAKFPLLLSRIIQKLHLRVSAVLERFVPDWSNMHIAKLKALIQNPICSESFLLIAEYQTEFKFKMHIWHNTEL